MHEDLIYDHLGKDGRGQPEELQDKRGEKDLQKQASIRLEDRRKRPRLVFVSSTPPAWVLGSG